MTDRELMKQALDALDSDSPDIQLRAAIALRERLAQPEQEPVAWRYDLKKGGSFAGVSIEYSRVKLSIGKNWQPLYTAPPQRKPLTELEILDLLPDAQHGWTTAFYGKWVARAVERAHGIKENT